MMLEHGQMFIRESAEVVESPANDYSDYEPRKIDSHKQSLLKKVMALSAKSISSERGSSREGTRKIVRLAPFEEKPPRSNSNERSYRGKLQKLGPFETQSKRLSSADHSKSNLLTNKMSYVKSRNLATVHVSPNLIMDDLENDNERIRKTVNQLYEGEKARNMILSRTNEQLQAKFNQHKEDMDNIDYLKDQITYYKEIVLKYEHAASVKEKEMETLQEAIGSGVKQLHDQNDELQNMLREKELQVKNLEFQNQSLTEQIQRITATDMDLKQA